MINTHKGSITVEVIVMLGLIATLTPILYKHVAERRQDIETINEANTLLLLKNATAEYIEANKETLTTGVLSPTDIGVDISGYQIGIRKDSAGKIDAMITGVGGNDLRAAKVASLLGVSAGIYSAQNLTKAWGINGVWAEDISNYGFTSLPTGIPVVTTAYDKEENQAQDFNLEELLNALENETLKVKKLVSESICLGDSCLSKWEYVNNPDLSIIDECMKNISEDCQKAWEKNLNRTCSEIAATYQKSGKLAQSGLYRLSTSATASEEKACLFRGGEAVTSKEALEMCNASGGNYQLACRYSYENNLNRNCSQVLAILGEGTYRISSSITAFASACCGSCCVKKTILSGTGGTATAPCSGRYLLTVKGQGSYYKYTSKYGWTSGWDCSGGTASGYANFSKGTIFSIQTKAGGLITTRYNSGSNGTSYGLSGIGILAGGTLFAVAGGGGKYNGGGGGYVGGAGGSSYACSSNTYGESGGSFVSGSATSSCTDAAQGSGAGGGALWSSDGCGGGCGTTCGQSGCNFFSSRGAGKCISLSNCTTTVGGNSGAATASVEFIP